jgi:hypothetical protein
MPWVRLLKSFEKHPIGQIMNVSRARYKQLTSGKIAEDYDGDRPPKSKPKTNFFKPK